MKENVDKQIENLVEKVMKQSTLEKPSFDFTANVMSQVESSSHSMVTTYQPLISKRMWMLIVTGFVAFVAYIVVVNKPEASDWFANLDFSIVNNDKVSDMFSGFKAPKIAAYSVGFLSVMLLVQISYLKNRFDKRFQV